jgi:hypothetical protein
VLAANTNVVQLVFGRSARCCLKLGRMRADPRSLRGGLKRKSSINDDLVGGLMVIFAGDFS